MLAMAVQYWVDQMASDADSAMRERKSELMDAELDKFMRNVNTSTMKVSSSTWF